MCGISNGLAVGGNRKQIHVQAMEMTMIAVFDKWLGGPINSHLRLVMFRLEPADRDGNRRMERDGSGAGTTSK